MKLNAKNASFIGIIVAVLVLITLFLPIVGEGNNTLTGLEVAFGKASENGVFGIKANILTIVAYGAAAAAAVLLFVEPKNGFIAALLFVSSAALLIIGPTTVKAFIGNFNHDFDATLGLWAYVAAALSVVGAVVSAQASLLTNKRK